MSLQCKFVKTMHKIIIDNYFTQSIVCSNTQDLVRV